VPGDCRAASSPRADKGAIRGDPPGGKTNARRRWVGEKQQVGFKKHAIQEAGFTELVGGSSHRLGYKGAELQMGNLPANSPSTYSPRPIAFFTYPALFLLFSFHPGPPPALRFYYPSLLPGRGRANELGSPGRSPPIGRCARGLQTQRWDAKTPNAEEIWTKGKFAAVARGPQPGEQAVWAFQH